jgi:hypothetical protein
MLIPVLDEGLGGVVGEGPLFERHRRGQWEGDRTIGSQDVFVKTEGQIEGRSQGLGVKSEFNQVSVTGGL